MRGSTSNNQPECLPLFRIPPGDQCALLARADLLRVQRYAQHLLQGHAILAGTVILLLALWSTRTLP